MKTLRIDDMKYEVILSGGGPAHMHRSSGSLNREYVISFIEDRRGAETHDGKILYVGLHEHDRETDKYVDIATVDFREDSGQEITSSK